MCTYVFDQKRLQENCSVNLVHIGKYVESIYIRIDLLIITQHKRLRITNRNCNFTVRNTVQSKHVLIPIPILHLY